MYLKVQNEQEYLNRLFSYYKNLGERKLKLATHPDNRVINPLYSSPEKDVFRIFDDMQNTRPVAVIIGQDPYPQPNTATGIAFANSGSNDKPLSPSLKVIQNSVLSFCGGEFDKTLMLWVMQGIMPINVAWTVQYNQPGSHLLFWTSFTSSFIHVLSQSFDGICYILLGKVAQQLKPSICSGTILEEYHPSYYVRNDSLMPATVWKEMVRYVEDTFDIKLKLTYDKNE